VIPAAKRENLLQTIKQQNFMMNESRRGSITGLSKDNASQAENSHYQGVLDPEQDPNFEHTLCSRRRSLLPHLAPLP